ncbi:hypothetical protein SLEP1_g36619 [Rubroshorea leprosula]|uniref:Uncharacterized protein n=1 Tax=Rubroshorea leprosula TaxID=152421 RepID=A0AAV5KS12_9ROSI|nr:hypothetical protein SLEP1_g36619 [Rubroshorea leprosula]
MPQMPVSSTPCASIKPSFLSVLPRLELVVFPYETKLPPLHSRSLATSPPGSARQDAALAFSPAPYTLPFPHSSRTAPLSLFPK